MDKSQSHGCEKGAVCRYKERPLLNDSLLFFFIFFCVLFMRASHNETVSKNCWYENINDYALYTRQRERKGDSVCVHPGINYRSEKIGMHIWYTHFWLLAHFRFICLLFFGFVRLFVLQFGHIRFLRIT